MNTSDTAWHEDKVNNGWGMPPAPAWKRMPIIRHIRSIYHSIGVARHEALWMGMGFTPRGYDRWVVYGIRRGWEAAE